MNEKEPSLKKRVKIDSIYFVERYLKIKARKFFSGGGVKVHIAEKEGKEIREPVKELTLSLHPFPEFDGSKGEAIPKQERQEKLNEKWEIFRAAFPDGIFCDEESVFENTRVKKYFLNGKYGNDETTFYLQLTSENFRRVYDYIKTEDPQGYEATLKYFRVVNTTEENKGRV